MVEEGNYHDGAVGMFFHVDHEFLQNSMKCYFDFFMKFVSIDGVIRFYNNID